MRSMTQANLPFVPTAAVATPAIPSQTFYFASLAQALAGRASPRGSPGRPAEDAPLQSVLPRLFQTASRPSATGDNFGPVLEPTEGTLGMDDDQAMSTFQHAASEPWPWLRHSLPALQSSAACPVSSDDSAGGSGAAPLAPRVTVRDLRVKNLLMQRIASTKRQRAREQHREHLQARRHTVSALRQQLSVVVARRQLQAHIRAVEVALEAQNDQKVMLFSLMTPVLAAESRTAEETAPPGEGVPLPPAGPTDAAPSARS
ncbi:hypothetical protein H696_01416 [Fonticula alba]|uniref:Uncharacterized protein n=1 Tax=Fonticula alba TaxID=691883 RepID=A0A058ZCA5_FONAL|nr:hypothetical protein H696_01416 [Fonticula alba]KCV72009.1 hypothetical protein H696_01416 [Fonticula alba]|eukprot:XP_009493587.1 hypothetical protein H696_01416 [Fonticula alba]